jgi:hypothetical protein
MHVTQSPRNHSLTPWALLGVVGLAGCPYMPEPVNYGEHRMPVAVVARDVEPPYVCKRLDGTDCERTRLETRLDGMFVDHIAAYRGFAGYAAFAQNADGSSLGERGTLYLGRLAWDGGEPHWHRAFHPLNVDDFRVAALNVAPSGDVVVAGRGQGENLLGARGNQFDGLVASFGDGGAQRFVVRLPGESPNGSPQRYHYDSFDVLARDRCYVAARSYIVVRSQPQYRTQLFAFERDGTIVWTTTIFEGSDGSPDVLQQAADGSLWVRLGAKTVIRVLPDGTVADRHEQKPGRLNGIVVLDPNTVMMGVDADKQTRPWFWQRGQVSSGSSWASCGARCTNGYLMGAVDRQANYFVRKLVGDGPDQTVIEPVAANGTLGPGFTITGIAFPRVFLAEEGLFLRHTRLGTELFRQPLTSSRRLQMPLEPEPEE